MTETQTKNLNKQLAIVVPFIETLRDQLSTAEFAKQVGLSVAVTLRALNHLLSVQHTTQEGSELCCFEGDAGNGKTKGQRSSGPAKYIWFTQ